MRRRCSVCGDSPAPIITLSEAAVKPCAAQWKRRNADR
jgi:hypothetical protein